MSRARRVSGPLRGFLSCGALLIVLILCSIAPAAANVYELAPDGTFHLRADDRGPQAAAGAVPSEDVGFEVPATAVTLIGDSVAPAKYAAAVHHFAALNELSPALLEAVVWQESRWRPNARSHAGAFGLAQLMPGTARDLGVDPRDPVANLAGGARYLRQQLDRFDGDVERALAAYNAGPDRVRRAGGVPPIRETQLYVRAVVGRMAQTSAR